MKSNLEKNPNQNLILFGYKSSGKTYYGRLLAEKLGKPFIDTDHLVEQLFKSHFQEDLDCRQISIKLGESGFRKLEEKVIEGLKTISDSIIALGGGAVLNPENCIKLNKIGKLIYLKTDKKIIKSRIFNCGIPSFLDPKNPEESFEKMYEGRRLIYQNISKNFIETYEKTDLQILNELCNLLIK